MTARRIGLARSGSAGLLGSAALLVATAWAAGQSPTADLRATESFRSAAALEDRGLYDLAAAEWDALLEEHPHNRLANQARFHYGVCLFALEKYTEAACEFERVLKEGASLDDALREQAQANLGLAQYNVGRLSADSSGDGAYDAALVTFGSLVQQFPDGRLAPQAVFYSAEIAYARGELAASISGYQGFLAKYADHPLRAQALYALGVAQQEHGQPAAASTLQQFVCTYPNHSQAPDAHARLAESLFAQAQAEQREGRLADADCTLSRLLSTYPHHEQAAMVRLTRASVRHDLRRYADALNDIKALLATRPARSLHSDALLVRGMGQAALGETADAVRTYESILADDPAYGSADRVLYELAWAYSATNRTELATATFGRLATLHPKSPLAAECWFRVGESQYTAGEFATAAESFQSAQRLSKEAELQEKAAYKQGWARFALGKFDEAQEAFKEQRELFPNGPLSGDALFMVAESQFKLQDYEAAFESYTAALEEDASSASSNEVRGIAMLHAAQAANQLNLWERSLQFLERCEREFPNNGWTAEIRCERGWALYHQQKLDEARREFEFVAGNRADALGARARFMLGEIHFACREYDAAVRTFFKVAYGYGGADAPPQFRRWQAEATFEAARCLEQTRRHDSARRLYRELLTYYPDSPKAALARVALDGLKAR